MDKGVIDRLIRSFVHFALARRAMVLGIVGVLTVVALGVLPNAVLASSLQSMFFGADHPGWRDYLDRSAEFGTDEVFVFGVETSNPLAPETLKNLRLFEEKALEVEEIARVTSVANLERVGLAGDTIGVRSFADEALADPARAGPLLDELRSDPIAGGLLVGRHGKDTLVLVEMRPNPNRSAEQGPITLAALLNAFEASGFDSDTIHPGGRPALIFEMVSVSERNLTVLFPFVSLALLGAVFLMFGRLWPVFVTTASALVAVIWAAAFAIGVRPEVNILMSILPAFVMIISFSDVVHMCSAYLLNLESGSDKRTAIVDATAEVGSACFLTSITTSVGFLAMVWIPAPAFSHLGLASAVGVVTAYVLAMVLVPLLLDILPRPEPWHLGRAAVAQKLIDDVLGGLAALTTKRPWPIIAFFTCFTVFLAVSAAQIEFETDFGRRLAADSKVRVDQRYLEENFVDSTIVDGYVETAGEGGVLDPETFAKLVEFEQRLEARDDVEKVVSLVDLMRATHRSIVGRDAAFGPFGAAELAQMMVLLEMQGADALRPFVDFTRQEVRLTVHTNVHGIVGLFGLRTAIESIGSEVFGDAASVTVTGVGPLMGGWLDNILAGQRRGLLFSLLVIALLLVVGFRSFSAGIVSMVPNVIPLLAAGAYCGLAWDATDSDTLLVGMIALGIGVDDTIHFVARYKLEERRHVDRTAAIRETFRFSGRGIFITTFVFVAGFLPLLASDYRSIWVMGLLLPLCFVVALVADVLFVPALLKTGLIRFGKPRSPQ